MNLNSCIKHWTRQNWACPSHSVMDSALALHTKSFLMISTQLPTGPLPCDNCRSTLDLFFHTCWQGTLCRKPKSCRCWDQNNYNKSRKKTFIVKNKCPDGRSSLSKKAADIACSATSVPANPIIPLWGFLHNFRTPPFVVFSCVLVFQYFCAC